MQLSAMFSTLAVTLALNGFIGCQPAKVDSAVSADHQMQHPDTPAVHGMLVFGTDSLWLSHLPMFHQPHDYQVIMQVTLKKDGVDLLPTYLVDRAQTNAAYYTFVPKRFSMTHLVSGHLTSIEGDLVRGHFERGGQTIASGVIAEINAIPVRERFVAGAAKPATAEYYVLGNKEESWLVHTIVAKPDEYDQVINATLNPEFWDTNASGSIIQTPLANTPELRLPEGQDIQATDAAGLIVNVSNGTELYIETGDLEI